MIVHRYLYRVFVSLFLALLVQSLPAQASDKGWQKASDVAVYSLLTASIAVPLIKDDEAGAWQAGGSFAATSLVTEGMKQAFPKTRPDGSDRKSFPSGHTSRAFAAAASLYNRNGSKIGVPAFVVAGFTGLARVGGRKHYWVDVAVGAGLGGTIGFLITKERPASSQTVFLPWADTSGGGVTIAARF